MAAGVKTLSKTFVWILMGLLIAGLAGFGAVNLTGTVRTVATVGSQLISVDEYARELQREIRGVEAQTGQTLPMSQVRQLGLDQVVLARLVSLASLDDEVAGLGVSIGDANLQQEIITIPAFQGIDGKFDRQGYRFALEQARINEAEFEADLRAESARTLVQGAIMANAKMPSVMVDTLADFVASRRSFTLAQVDASSLAAPLPAPAEADLQDYYDTHTSDFTLPESKQLTYVLLTSEMVLDQVEIDESALRQLFQERSAQYSQPERRLVERLVFPDETAAKAAMAQLEVKGTTFEALVTDRDLALGDIDLGDVTTDDLGAAGVAVFAAEIGDVVGPLPSPLGPSLFRVNGTLAARNTTFDEVQAELRDELAGERARRLIEAQAENIDDLLAGGATLEDLSTETDMELGDITWTSEAFEGVAAYEGFRSAATAVTDKDFPKIAFLDDGGIFALRLDEVLPEHPEPFDQARNQVSAALAAEQLGAALRARAQDAVAQIAVSGDFAETGLSFRVENGLSRTAYLENTPADFMTQVFEMELGEMRVIDGDGAVYLARLDEKLPPEETTELAAMKNAFGEELDQALSQALFQAFVQDAQVRAKPNIDQRALNAVQAGFQ